MSVAFGFLEKISRVLNAALLLALDLPYKVLKHSSYEEILNSVSIVFRSVFTLSSEPRKFHISVAKNQLFLT